VLMACYFQQWWTRYSLRIAIFDTPTALDATVNFSSLQLTRQRYTIDDRNVALEKGEGVAPPCSSDIHLADALVLILCVSYVCIIPHCVPKKT